MTPTSTSFSLLGDMPLDIFLEELTSHLTDTSKVALSLACRDFYNHLGNTPLFFANFAERRQFLTCILRDCPGLMTCHDCGRLHTKAGTIERRNDDEEWVELIDPCQEARQRFRNYGPSIEFFHVQLVTDAHFFSPAHGIPLSALVLPSGSGLRPPRSVEENYFEAQIEARLAGGELVVKARFNIWREDGGGDDGALFSAAMKELERDVCPHVSFDAYSPLRHYHGEMPYVGNMTLNR